MFKFHHFHSQNLISKEPSYTVFFEPLAEGGYNVVFPAIPEICTFGETLEEARVMAKDALRCYLESLVKDGLPFPRDKRTELELIKEKLSVAI